jgi:hypothetical protein
VELGRKTCERGKSVAFEGEVLSRKFDNQMDPCHQNLCMAVGGKVVSSFDRWSHALAHVSLATPPFDFSGLEADRSA